MNQNEHVKAYQIHSHSRTCGKYKKKDCRLSYGRFVSASTILAKSRFTQKKSNFSMKRRHFD